MRAVAVASGGRPYNLRIRLGVVRTHELLNAFEVYGLMQRNVDSPYLCLPPDNLSICNNLICAWFISPQHGSADALRPLKYLLTGVAVVILLANQSRASHQSAFPSVMTSIVPNSPVRSTAAPT